MCHLCYEFVCVLCGLGIVENKHKCNVFDTYIIMVTNSSLSGGNNCTPAGNADGRNTQHNAWLEMTNNGLARR